MKLYDDSEYWQLVRNWYKAYDAEENVVLWTKSERGPDDWCFVHKYFMIVIENGCNAYVQIGSWTLEMKSRR